jgi:hypothetical protein
MQLLEVLGAPAFLTLLVIVFLGTIKIIQGSEQVK